MGKRKSSRKPMGPKKVEPLPTVFSCLFCNHEKSVTIKLEKKHGFGSLECKVCGQHFQTAINYLSAPVDVYGDWVDAAGKLGKHYRLIDGQTTNMHEEEAAAKGEGPALGSLEGSAARAAARKARDETNYSDAGHEYEGDDVVADDIED